MKTRLLAAFDDLPTKVQEREVKLLELVALAHKKRRINIKFVANDK